MARVEQYQVSRIRRLDISHLFQPPSGGTGWGREWGMREKVEYKNGGGR
jgi:hypothetical protein